MPEEGHSVVPQYNATCKKTMTTGEYNCKRKITFGLNSSRSYIFLADIPKLYFIYFVVKMACGGAPNGTSNLDFIALQVWV